MQRSRGRPRGADSAKQRERPPLSAIKGERSHSTTKDGERAARGGRGSGAGVKGKGRQPADHDKYTAHDDEDQRQSKPAAPAKGTGEAVVAKRASIEPEAAKKAKRKRRAAPEQAGERKESRAPEQSPKRQRCGSCACCQRPNCGKCASCLDMKLYEGLGQLQKPCLECVCVSMIWAPAASASPPACPPGQLPPKPKAAEPKPSKSKERAPQAQVQAQAQAQKRARKREREQERQEDRERLPPQPQSLQPQPQASPSSQRERTASVLTSAPSKLVLPDILEPSCPAPSCAGSSGAVVNANNMLQCSGCGLRWQSSWWCRYLTAARMEVARGKETAH